MASALAPTGQEILHAYRHLLRAGLRAVQFSKPSRYVLRDQLRAAFRDDDAGKAPRNPTAAAAAAGGGFDLERIRRTVWFLKAAGQEAGLEHKILKNLLRVAWARGGYHADMRSRTWETLQKNRKLKAAMTKSARGR